MWLRSSDFVQWGGEGKVYGCLDLKKTSDMKNQKKCKAILLVFIILFISIFSYSQGVELLGNIVDKEDNPILFASIQLHQTNFGCISNENGVFSFKIDNPNPTDSLKIACLGFRSKIIPISLLTLEGKSKIILEKDIIQLDEIIVKARAPLYLIKKAINTVDQNYINKPYVEQVFYRELIKEDNSYIGISEAIAEIQNFPGVFPVRDDYRNFMRLENSADYLNFGYNYIELFWNGNIISANKNYVKPKSIRSNNYLYKSHLKPIVTGSIGGLHVSNWVFNPTIFGFLIPERFERYNYAYEGLARHFDRDVFKIVVKPKNPERTQFEGVVYIDCENYAINYLKFQQTLEYDNYKEILIRNPALFANPQQYGENFITYNNMVTEVFFKPIHNQWRLSHIMREGSAMLNFSDDYLLEEAQKLRYEYRQIMHVTNVLEDTVIPNKEVVYNNESIQTLALARSDFNEEKSIWESFNQIHPTQLEDSVRLDLEKRKPLENQYVENSTHVEHMDIPRAKEIPHIIRTATKEMTDNYFWMQDISDSTVLSYINEENSYANNFLSKNKSLFKLLLQEQYLRERQSVNGGSFSDTIVLKDRFNPSRPYFYYEETNDGEILIERKAGNRIADTILNFENHKELIGYYPGFMTSSSSGKYIALILINVSENLKFIVLDLQYDRFVALNLNEIDGFIWSKKEDVLYCSTYKDYKPEFYSYDPLINKIDLLIEGDCFETFDYRLTNDLVVIEHRKSNGMRVLIHDNNGLLEVIPFKKATDYFLQYDGCNYFVHEIDSLGVTSIRVMSKELKTLKTFKPTKGFFKKNFHHFSDYLVAVQSYSMIDQLSIINYKSGQVELVSPELSNQFQEIFIDSLADNTVVFRGLSPFGLFHKYSYSLKRNEIKQIDVVEQMPGFNKDNYKIIRKDIKVDKGVKVPVLMIAKKGIVKPIFRSKHKMLLLDVYGSYGKINSPVLSNADISLLDRDVVIGKVHVRGGGEFGQQWWINGKNQLKVNAVNDYIVCAQKLVKKRYSQKGLLVARGVSAGGIPVGAALNKRPELFHTAIIKMGAVNELNYLLTANSYFSQKEFGNPHTKEGINKILEFEPYYNLKKQKYPNVILINGMNDSRVAYWQQLKYVAKMRKCNIGESIQILKTLYGTGHFGGEYNAETDAMINTFLLNSKSIH